MALSAIASVMMLCSIAVFMLASGDLSFNSLYNLFSAGPNRHLLQLAAGLFLCGLLIKSGLVPFHGWVPDAYSAAPASVSVLLAGIVTKSCGVYGLLRLFGSVFIMSGKMQEILLFVGALSICFAAFAAFRQNNFKRMLSYSSISQVGYIVLALGAGTPIAFAGAVFHLFNHAIFKSLLFVNASAVEKQCGSMELDRMSDCGPKMKVTGITSLIGLLSTAGIPPLSGFWSKLMIIVALFVSGRRGYAAVALLASALTLAYFLYLERKVFFGRSDMAQADMVKIPFGITFSEIMLAAITIGAGLGFVFIFNTWLLPLTNIFRHL